MNISKISFVGLGLIGGSLAKAIKIYHPEIKMYARASERTISEAFSLGLCENEKPLDIPMLADADILFLCCPVEVNVAYLEELKQYLKSDIIVTDVGSVKGDIQRAVAKLGLNEIFIGGHPMAGSDKSGLAYSSAELLEGCRYCLTTHDGKSNTKSRILADFLRTLKVRTRLLSYTEHDLSAASISHVPHILASTLCNMVEKHDESGAMKDMAATGFSDSTRIAKGDPDMWQQICETNKEAIILMLEKYEEELSRFKTILKDNNINALYEYLNSAKKYREKFDKC